MGVYLMKKVFIISAATLFFTICLTSISANDITIKTEPVEFREVELSRFEKIKTNLSHTEFEEDLGALCYLISTGYAGYEDMIENGFSIDSFKEQILSEFKEKEEINSRDFYFALVNGLKPFINDSHFMIAHFTDLYSFSTRKFCAWSDIFVKKDGDNYSVTESNLPAVKKGDIFTDDTTYLFYYPSKGKDTYRIGFLTDITPEIKKDFSFNNGSISVPLKQDGAIERRPMKYKSFETKDSAYIELNDFLRPEADSPQRKSADIVFNKFINLGQKYNSKKNIILDLRSNSGGLTELPLAFIFSLYTNKNFNDTDTLLDRLATWDTESFFERKQILSPSYYQILAQYEESRNNIPGKMFADSKITTQKQKTERIVVKNILKPSKLFSRGSKFKGKLIILTDRNTVSAGEGAILFAKQIFGNDKVYTVGENTYGMAEYWNVFDVQLQNSKMNIHTSFSRNETMRKNELWHGEGTGLYPDYWCTGSDLNETIFMITGDKEMKEKLKNIEFYLM